VLNEAADATFELLRESGHFRFPPLCHKLLCSSLLFSQTLGFLHGAREDLGCFPDISDLVAAGPDPRQIEIA